MSTAHQNQQQPQNNQLSQQLSQCIQQYESSKKTIHRFIILYLFFNFSQKKNIFIQHLESVQVACEDLNDIEEMKEEFDQELWEDIFQSYQEIKKCRQLIIAYLDNIQDDDDYLDQIEYLRCILFIVTYFINAEQKSILDEFYQPTLEENLNIIDFIIRSFEDLQEKLKFQQPKIDIDDYEDDSFKQFEFIPQYEFYQKSFQESKLKEIPNSNSYPCKQLSEFMQDLKDCFEIIGQEDLIEKQKQDKINLYLYAQEILFSQETKTNFVVKYNISNYFKFFDKFKFINLMADSEVINTLEEDELLLYFYFYSILNLIRNEFLFFNKEQKLYKIIEKLSSSQSIKNPNGYLFIMKLLKDINDKSIFVNDSLTLHLFQNWVETDYRQSNDWINKNQIKLFIDALESYIKLLLLPELASAYKTEENLPYQPTKVYFGFAQQIVRGKRLYVKYQNQIDKHIIYWEKLTLLIQKAIKEQKRMNIQDCNVQEQNEYNKKEKEKEYICIVISEINHITCIIKQNKSQNQENDMDHKKLDTLIQTFIELIDCTQYENIVRMRQLYFSLSSLFVEEYQILPKIINCIKKSTIFTENEFEAQSFRNSILSLKSDFQINKYISRTFQRAYTLQQVDFIFDQLRKELTEAIKDINKTELSLEKKINKFKDIQNYYGFLKRQKYNQFNTNINFYIQYIRILQEINSNTNQQIIYDIVQQDAHKNKSQFEILQVRKQVTQQILILKRQKENHLYQDRTKLRKDLINLDYGKQQQQQEVSQEKIQLIREISILREIPKHEHLIKMDSYHVTENGELEIFLEYCEKGSLENYILNHYYLNKTPQQELEIKKDKLRICKEILEGVEHLQKYIIIHSDLKLSNIVVTKNNTIKIIDLGTSAFMTEEILGYTDSYKSKDKQQGKNYDYYSLGLILINVLHNLQRKEHENKFYLETFSNYYYNHYQKCRCQQIEDKCICNLEHNKEFIKKKYEKFSISQKFNFIESYSQILFNQIMDMFNDQPYLRPQLRELIELFEIHLTIQDGDKDYLIQQEYKYCQKHCIISQLQILQEIKLNESTQNYVGQIQNIDQSEDQIQNVNQSANNEESIVSIQNEQNQNPINRQKSQKQLEDYYKKKVEIKEEYELKLLSYVKQLKLDFRRFGFNPKEIFMLKQNGIAKEDALKYIFQKYNINSILDISQKLCNNNSNNIFEIIQLLLQFQVNKNNVQKIKRFLLKYDN